ncbi:MAG: DUF2892 domain-containing protein [Thermoleophilia bacterium]|nr:DUF2892 domain-containing protein [Thermoleophilia bacterium]
MGLARFMSSTAGRLIRIIAGVALIAIGASMGGAGWILAAIGVVPIAAGVFNVCLLAPLLRAPFSGSKLRNS